MKFKSDEQRKAVFANLGNASIDSTKLPEVNTISDNYEKWLVKNTLDEYVQLDPRFPNLKGVTPNEVNKFVYDMDSDDSVLFEYKDRVKRHEEDYKIEEERLDNLLKLHDFMLSNKNLSFDEIREKVNGSDSKSLKEGLSQLLEYDKIMSKNIGGAKGDYDSFIEEYLQLKSIKLESLQQRVMESKNDLKDVLENIPSFRIKYLQNCKIYDRDEIYEDSRKLGLKLKDKLVELGALPKIGDLNNLTGNTIFITTPRGGHELLSIFSYANNIKKWSIPSLIEDNFGTKRAFKEGMSEGFTRGWNKGDALISDQDFINFKNGKFKELIDSKYRIYGNDWLNSAFSDSNVNNVVFVDDIIASGAQIKDVLDKVNKVFNDSENTINFIPISLSAREERFDSIRTQSETFYRNVNFIEPIYANKLVDLDTFKNRFLTNTMKSDDYVSIAFPWSIPDGESDRLLTKLYGGRYERNRVNRKFGRGSK